MSLLSVHDWRRVATFKLKLPDADLERRHL